MSKSSEQLTTVLTRAQSVGFLGPGEIDAHIRHADRYLSGLADESVEILDLGSGGGVPALPLVLATSDMKATLVDTSQRRCSFLVWAACELGIQDRVTVRRGRAEELARDEQLRGRFDGVTARGFGPPAWTFECAIGFLADRGRFVVSEPPGPRQWPDAETLANFGVTEVGPLPGIACFERTGEVPDHLPRSAKGANRQPLFTLEGLPTDQK